MPDLLERLESRPCHPRARHHRERFLAGVEDYLFIGGDQMSAREAAQRLGVAQRTVSRWRAALRKVRSGHD